jgi:hypothetical protein
MGGEGQIEVVTGLVHEVVEGLHERRAGVEVGAGAEEVQDLVAELVRRGDGRCVEARERGGESRTARFDGFGRRVGE